MKIAVTFDNGNIFQHFGRTEAFKIYEVEGGEVVRSEVISSNGSGHGALAGLLDGRGVSVLICGGIGGGAQAALYSMGIELCAGASGDADEAVAAYLKGELVNTGANCDHHDEDGCGHDCGENGCGSEGCGEGGGNFTVQGKNAGKKIRAHYLGKLNDGTVFDSSYEREEPLEFICGTGMMIKGFDEAVANMEVGQIVDIHLKPEDAYGEPDPAAIITTEITNVPGAENLSVGEHVYLQDMYGRPIPALVAAKDDRTITFDANHEMAGKELNFHIELVSVE